MCCAKSLQSCPTAVLWTAAHQAPLSMGFSRQECWSGLSCPDFCYKSMRILCIHSHRCERSKSKNIILIKGLPFGNSSGIHRFPKVRYIRLYSVKINIMKGSDMVVIQSCPTLCNPMDCSPPGSSVQGILQARILEWVAISFSKESSQPRDQSWVSCIAGSLYHLSHQGNSHYLVEKS